MLNNLKEMRMAGGAGGAASPDTNYVEGESGVLHVELCCEQIVKNEDEIECSVWRLFVDDALVEYCAMIMALLHCLLNEFSISLFLLIYRASQPSPHHVQICNKIQQ